MSDVEMGQSTEIVPRRKRLTRRQRRRCPHSNLRAIWGDEINALNSRLSCRDCGRLLDGPPSLAALRKGELS